MSNRTLAVLLATVLGLTGFLIALHASAAPDGGIARVIPDVVKDPIRAVSAVDAAFDRKDWPFIAATILTLLSFLLRRFVPVVRQPWIHSRDGLTVVAALSGILTGVAGAILADGLTARVISIAIMATLTSALAQATPLPGEKPTPPSPLPPVIS